MTCRRDRPVYQSGRRSKILPECLAWERSMGPNSFRVRAMLAIALFAFGIGSQVGSASLDSPTAHHLAIGCVILSLLFARDVRRLLDLRS
jgi:hypothetical protein